MYKSILLAGTAAILMGGAAITLPIGAGPDQAAAPFIHPVVLNSSVCGTNDPRLSRKATFMRLGYAMAQTADSVAAPGLSEATLQTISYPISTDVPEAQAAFNRGLAYTFGFNHGAAILEFQKAQAADPTCAMCYWGEAFALGPNINAAMPPEAYAPAHAAITKAAGLISDVTREEQMLVRALMMRYVPEPVADRAHLDTAFADLMEGAAQAFPENDLIAVIAAEANMDTQPWVYWDATGRTPEGRTARTLELLEGVLARSPDYPPAIHLYIHITEASSDPYRAAPYADQLATLTPEIGHLVHMPSHTYYRIGRWKQSLDHNIVAVAADAAFIENNDAAPFYEFGYFTHNIHFALTSAMTGGAKDTALEMAALLDEKLPLPVARDIPFSQPIKAAPLYAYAMFAATDDILALPAPGADVPFLQAAWHYARGEALARDGRLEGAKTEADAIKALAGTDLTGLTDLGIPAPQIIAISHLTVEARIAAARGDLNTAISLMEEVVALQDALPYMEPPYWYYPARQTLAAFVLRAGNGERAEQIFMRTLIDSPNNAYAYYGLSKAYGAQGDRRARRYASRLYKDAWLGGRRDGPDLAAL